jgi:hypothetical protein
MLAFNRIPDSSTIFIGGTGKAHTYAGSCSAGIDDDVVGARGGVGGVLIAAAGNKPTADRTSASVGRHDLAPAAAASIGDRVLRFAKVFADAPLRLPCGIFEDRPIPSIGSILYLSQTPGSQSASATSNYNALQVTFSQQLLHGISFRGFYTFSKTMSSGNLDSSSNLAAEDSYLPQLEKGPSGLDRRHVFSLAMIVKTNYFHKKPLHILADGWTISPVVRLSSGTPFTVTAGVDSNQDGVNNDRPNQIGNPLVSGNGITLSTSHTGTIRYFNPTAYCSYTITAPTACLGTGPAGSDGTVSRNSLIGPGARNVNLGISRDFPIYEKTYFQIRGAATNVFNSVNLNNPSTSIGASSATSAAGTISGAGQMRLIEVGGRLVF